MMVNDGKWWEILGKMMENDGTWCKILWKFLWKIWWNMMGKREETKKKGFPHDLHCFLYHVLFEIMIVTWFIPKNMGNQNKCFFWGVYRQQETYGTWFRNIKKPMGFDDLIIFLISITNSQFSPCFFSIGFISISILIFLKQLINI